MRIAIWLCACASASTFASAVTACGVFYQVDEPTVDAPSLDASRADATPGPACPTSYLPVGSGFYRFETTPLPWVSAEAACEADGAGLVGKHTHLAVTGPTTDEIGAIYAYTHAQQTSKVWLGLTDRRTRPQPCNGSDTALYEWVTDEPADVPTAHTPPWFPSDPLLPCTQNCVEMLDNEPALDDASCADAYPFICECDAYAADPARY